LQPLNFGLFELVLDHLDDGCLQANTEVGRQETLVLHVDVSLVRFFRLAQVFLDYALLLHAFAPLLFFSVLVPEAVKEYIFNLSARIVFSYNMQVLFCFISRDKLDIVYRQNFNNSLESANVLFVIETVVE